MNWIGALLLALSGYAFGINIAKKEGERLKNLDSLIYLFEFLYRRMETERCPLYEIFLDFSDDRLENEGFLAEIRMFPNNINDGFKSAVDMLAVDGDIKRELFHFGETLGTLTLDAQLGRIKAINEIIWSRRNELRVSLPKKQKSIRTVCSLFGILTAIILM